MCKYRNTRPNVLLTRRPADANDYFGWHRDRPRQPHRARGDRDKTLARRRFDALAGYARNPKLVLFAEEMEWYASRDERVIGMLLRWSLALLLQQRPRDAIELRSVLFRDFWQREAAPIGQIGT